jgi:hypothetical protein
MRPESTARNVSERIDALAEALRRAGVPAEQSARLLASAASAAMSAVTLDAILSEPPAAPAAPAEVPEITQPVRLAA